MNYILNYMPNDSKCIIFCKTKWKSNDEYVINNFSNIVHFKLCCEVCFLKNTIRMFYFSFKTKD